MAFAPAKMDIAFDDLNLNLDMGFDFNTATGCAMPGPLFVNLADLQYIPDAGCETAQAGSISKPDNREVFVDNIDALPPWESPMLSDPTTGSSPSGSPLNSAVPGAPRSLLLRRH